jgi:hypothetical protein
LLTAISHEAVRPTSISELQHNTLMTDQLSTQQLTKIKHNRSIINKTIMKLGQLCVQLFKKKKDLVDCDHISHTR